MACVFGVVIYEPYTYGGSNKGPATNVSTHNDPPTLGATPQTINKCKGTDVLQGNKKVDNLVLRLFRRAKNLFPLGLCELQGAWTPRVLDMLCSFLTARIIKLNRTNLSEISLIPIEFSLILCLNDEDKRPKSFSPACHLPGRGNCVSIYYSSD